MNNSPMTPKHYEVFERLSAQVCEALETIKHTAHTGSGVGGNEFFNLTPEANGVYMQLHLLDGKLLSLYFFTKEGLECEGSCRTAPVPD